MYIVELSKYPKGKDWSEKVFSTPSVPGGKDMVLNNLRQLLMAVKNGEPMDQIPQLEGSNSKYTLHEMCVHKLSAMNFVRRVDDEGWKLTEESELWLDSGDDLYLAAYFCANVKFFAEILYYLDSPKTSRELYNIAVNEYDMAWKIVTTINNRLVWLRQFGLIEFQSFSLLYNLTDKGKDFLKNVVPVMPEEIARGYDDTATEEDVSIDEIFIAYYEDNKNALRKMGFGYFPGKLNDFDKTLLAFLSQVANDSSIENLYSFTREKYSIKDSSVKSALNTISLLGLMERKTNSSYAVTDLGHAYIDNSDMLSLLPLFQLRYLFFFELLLELEDNNLSVKELATIAKVSYGFDKDNTVEINNRLVILKQAKLVINVSAEKLTLTHRGKLLLDKYASVFGIEKRHIKNITVEQTDNKDILSELRTASKDSYNPDRFEKIVRDYFEAIGFEAQWLGGSGKTDVLIKTKGLSADSFVVTVDAKATQSSAVTDSLVDFDTLKEHQKKHDSDYIAVVGRDFNERVIKRAKEHRVVLFDLETLEKMLNINQETPLKISSYRKIFEQSGKADLSVLDKEVQDMKNIGLLLIGVMQRLVDECDDPVTKGQLSVRDLYMSLRNSPDFIISPRIEEIETVLGFLSSPIIGCVAKEKDFYYATGSLGDMAKILGFFKDKCIY